MKLLLVNLYPPGTLAKYLLSSYVLKAYLEKYLSRENPLSVEVMNFSSKTSIREICDGIVGSGPDWVGYSCYAWNMEKIIRTIKELDRTKEYIHILGGPEISVGQCSFLAGNAIGDFYVIGEGEKKTVNLIKYLLERNRSSNRGVLKGIAHRNHRTFSYVEDDSVMELSTIPSVYLSGAIEEGLYERQLAFLETQRGCRYRCKYCVYHKGLPRIAYYPLQRIIEELDYLILEKHVLALRIVDAVFASDLERAKAIVRHLCELKGLEGVRLPWIYWEFVYNGVDEEFLELIARLKYSERICNSRSIAPIDRPQLYYDLLRDYTAVNCVGVQSFCREALRAVGRAPINLRRFADFMRLVWGYNIVLKVDMILGLPFESFESYFKGLEFILPYFKGTDHILNIHLLQILPGSELEALCKEYKVVYSKDAPHAVLSTSTMSQRDLIRASKLTAILFRLFNSPMRQHFFTAKERRGIFLLEILQEILDRITESEQFKAIRLMQDDIVDDDYWNEDIYREIPSQWLVDFLTSC